MFNIILFLVISYYLFKLIIRYILPLLLRNRIKKMAAEKEGAYDDYINQQKEKEGKVVITRKPSSNNDSLSKKDLKGEYVDYEEIK